MKFGLAAVGLSVVCLIAAMAFRRTALGEWYRAWPVALPGLSCFVRDARAGEHARVC